MTDLNSRYTDFEDLRKQVLTLRRQGLSRRQIRDRVHIHNNDLLNRLLDGEPAPAWTRRPNAKDELREKARALRLEGLTYDQIQLELGCSKGSISLWVRDLPKPERLDAKEQATLAARKRWEHELAVRDEERQRTKAAARAEIGRMPDRELFVAGVALYWAEGSKEKVYARRERVVLINSDADIISLYLAWLDLLGVERHRLRFRLSIHESADVPAAEHHWARVVRTERSTFQRATLKKHNPKTVRKNVADGYHGCLTIVVQDSADLYRRVEGWWCGIVSGVTATD
ncbi:hypothetical protein [Streptomyces fuscigenes]|uniref:hypothetical protein n=1 Tax=Streptomyces fuscigenes TaxID=1528880 RepID=UPI001F1C0F79|nr:hypothetical protein [Streptomyces fuscigenes]MCF3961770.1 hypothetical protein [Streptomyces fuscigenes]